MHKKGGYPMGILWLSYGYPMVRVRVGLDFCRERGRKWAGKGCGEGGKWHLPEIDIEERD